MKKTILFILLVLVSNIGFSQVTNQAKLEISAPYKVIDAGSKYYVRIGDEILTVKIAGKKLHMQKMNAKTLAFISVNTAEDMPEGFDIESLQLFNSRCFLFFSLWNREAKTEQLFYREINFSKGEFAGEEKLLFKEEGKISGTLTSNGFYSFSVRDKFDFFTSYDSSKMIIQYRMVPEEKRDSKNSDLIGLRVFGRNLEKIWGDVIQMPYTEKQMENIDYSVDSDGNAYILSTVFDDNTTDIKKRRDENANYHIELLKVKANTTSIEKNVIKLGQKFINTIWLYEGPNNFMYCAGFYNDGVNLSAANGIFMFKITNEGKVYDERSYEIPVEVLNQYVNARTQKKNEKKDEKGEAEFAQLELKEFIIEDDGSIVLIGEQHYITSRTYYTSNGSSRTTYYYHFNDILITKINPDGRLGYMKKLGKRQTASSSAYMPKYQGGMSYTMIPGKDSYNILFLDNIKNLDLKLDEFPAGHTDGLGGYLTSYKVNKATGEVSKVAVFDVRNVDGIPIYQFSVDRILSYGLDEFIVEAYKKKKEDILIKVKLKP